MSESQRPAYWAVIPANVRYDTTLPPNAKLLYAEISSLANATGYCYAQNEYFAGNFGISIKSVQRLLKALADKGYISVLVDRDGKTNEVTGRRIFAGVNPASALAPPSPQKCGDPSPQKCGGEYLNIINTIPPLPPKGDGPEDASIQALSLALPDIRGALGTWLAYKRERKSKYTPTGLSRLIAKANDSAKKYGAAAVGELIEHCIANNYQGITWDKLSRSAQQARAPAAGRVIATQRVDEL